MNEVLGSCVGHREPERACEGVKEKKSGEQLVRAVELIYKSAGNRLEVNRRTMEKFWTRRGLKDAKKTVLFYCRSTRKSVKMETSWWVAKSS